MGTYEKKVNQLKDLMVRKYKSTYDKSKGIDLDISQYQMNLMIWILRICMLFSIRLKIL